MLKQQKKKRRTILLHCSQSNFTINPKNKYAPINSNKLNYIQPIQKQCFKHNEKTTPPSYRTGRAQLTEKKNRLFFFLNDRWY